MTQSLETSSHVKRTLYNTTPSQPKTIETQLQTLIYQSNTILDTNKWSCTSLDM